MRGGGEGKGRGKGGGKTDPVKVSREDASRGLARTEVNELDTTRLDRKCVRVCTTVRVCTRKRVPFLPLPFDLSKSRIYFPLPTYLTFAAFDPFFIPLPSSVRWPSPTNDTNEV